MTKVAVVTGGNRGIGYAISKALRDTGHTVILTSRNEWLGKKAARDLDVDYYQLDVCDDKNVKDFKNWVTNKYKKVDVLVNNAGTFFRTKDKEYSLDTSLDTFQKTLNTNSLGPIRMIKAMAPLMIKNGYGRIVNITSRMGQLSSMDGGYLAYRMSKTALNAVTKNISKELKGTGILINCMHPGHVKTRMGGIRATREPEQAAKWAVWLATLPKNGPTGKFFLDGREIPW